MNRNIGRTCLSFTIAIWGGFIISALDVIAWGFGPVCLLAMWVGGVFDD